MQGSVCVKVCHYIVFMNYSQFIAIKPEEGSIKRHCLSWYYSVARLY
jgi:hypothetical protein